MFDNDAEKVKNLLAEIVDPSARANINIIPSHVTILRGSKSKKQLSHKRKQRKSAVLTRQEAGKLGLYHLPTKGMSFADCQPLHRLWKSYIKEHLSLKSGQMLPGFADNGYDAFSKLLVKSDFHGAVLSVVKSKCPSLVGLSGVVVMDTKNTFKLIGEDNTTRTVPKSECIFSMKFGSAEFTLFGKHLTIRPAERSVKKIKNFIDADL